MIYHKITSTDLNHIYLNLEELICLSTLTNTICTLKAPDCVKEIFDLSGFQLTDEESPVIPYDISDYVCVYESDFGDMDGSEFISYRSDKYSQIFKLDKLTNLNIIFSKPNYYESKYFSSDKERYSLATQSAFEFGLSSEFKDKYSFINSLFGKLPLLCLRSKDLLNLMSAEMEFQFSDCYYICDEEVFDEFFAKHQLKAINAKKYLHDYHHSFKNLSLDMLLLLIDKFTEVYGLPGDYQFGILSKKFPQYILGTCNFATISNFQFKVVYPQATFVFSQCNFDCERSEVMSLVRDRLLLMGISH